MPRPSRAARRGDFHFITSMIWVPIGNSGLNDPNGSCGMKVMLRPRIPSATWRAGRRNRSSPRKRIVPPGRMARLTPSRTRAAPCPVAYETKRFSTSTRLPAGARTSNPRIENVAQSVPEKIETHHDQEDRKPRRERVPPGVGKELARFRDHAAPFRGRRRRAEGEKAERA